MTRLALTAFLILSVSACAHIGADSIRTDRIDYASAMAESWKQQMLLNIVKLRYFDPPTFLDVSSVIGAYELERQIALSAGFGYQSEKGANNILGATGTFTDSPTITYTPLTGEKFINALLKPLPPQTIFAMIETGHPADFILPIAVDAIDGIHNGSSAPARSRHPDRAFRQVAEAIGRIQEAGDLSLRMEKRNGHEETWLSFRDDGDPAAARDIAFVTRTLRLHSATGDYLLTFGSRQHRPDEIALLTRSMQEILVDLGAGVEVPPSDVTEGRATKVPPLTGGDCPLVHIHSGDARPADAYAAIRYRTHWFWIDDRDLQSKRIFMFLMIFSSLAETGVVPQTPIITIPAH
jgi:hypothetical protein